MPIVRKLEPKPDILGQVRAHLEGHPEVELVKEWSGFDSGSPEGMRVGNRTERDPPFLGLVKDVFINVAPLEPIRFLPFTYSGTRTMMSSAGGMNWFDQLHGVALRVGESSPVDAQLMPFYAIFDTRDTPPRLDFPRLVFFEEAGTFERRATLNNNDFVLPERVSRQLLVRFFPDRQNAETNMHPPLSLTALRRAAAVTNP
jgi:hypothetical protein